MLAVMSGCAQESGGSEKEGLTKVGMTVMTLDNPYFVAFQNSLEQQAEEHGFEPLISSADFDLAKQQSQIETFITKDVDVILLNAVDSRGIAGAVQQAKQADIPVIAVDVGADGGTTATVMSDNYQAGKLAGEYIVERLNGEGNVVLLNGNPITSIFDRVDGFKEAIKGTDIEVVAEQNGKLNRDESYKKMENVLSSHQEGEIDAVFGVNDPTSIGGYLAAKSAGRTDIFFSSVDGSEAAVEFIKEESDMFGFTAAQHPEQEVVEAIKLAKKIIKGEEVPEETLVPVDPVSDENVDEFEPEF